MREARLDQAGDDLTGRLAAPAQAGPAAMGQLHRVIARDVEAAMVLADQPRGRRQVQGRPAADG